MLLNIQLLLLAVCVIVFIWINSKNRDWLESIRSFGFLLSLLIVFTFNLNWLLKTPLTLWNSFFFLSLVDGVAIYWQRVILSDKFRNDLGRLRKIDLKEALAYFLKSLIFPGILVVFTFLYFQGDISVPRYESPDPGEHYLQMSRTAQTGFMPLFLPVNEMYEASGFNAIFLHHHDTYFPGATVPFFFIYKTINGESSAVSLQVFNILFYIMLVVYLYLLVVRDYTFKWRALNVFLFLMLSLGTIFDFLITSFSTQLFGLFLLVCFADSFYEFYKGKTSFIQPAIVLSSLLMAYVYWIPAAFLFIGIIVMKEIMENRQNDLNTLLKKIFTREMFPFVAVALLLSVGYIINMIRVSLLGYSTADGAFNFYNLFISDTLLLLPFAAVGFYYLFKKQTEKSFLFLFSLSILSYSGILYIAYKFTTHIVSNYARLKVLYIAIPVIWIISLIAFEKVFLFVMEKRGKIFSKLIFKKHQVLIYVFILGFILSLINIILGAKPKFFPVVKNNIEHIISANNSPNLTKDQIELLNIVKDKYRFALEDNRRMFIIAPSKTALWAFAYSGIWPRTYSLLADDEKNNTIWSSMSFYSAGIANYGTWLRNDKSHILLYFDNSESASWIKEMGFNIDDYKVLAFQGENKLLQLKSNLITDYSNVNNHPGLKNAEKITFPYADEIIPSEDYLKSLSFKFAVSNRKLKDTDNYDFTFSAGDCSMNGVVILRKEFPISYFKDLNENDFFEINFEHPLLDSKNKKYCIKIMSKDGEGKGLRIVRVIKEKELVLSEIYGYQN